MCVLIQSCITHKINVIMEMYRGGSRIQEEHMQSACEIFSHAHFEVDHTYFKLNHARSRHEELVNQAVLDRLSFKGKVQQEYLSTRKPGRVRWNP